MSFSGIHQAINNHSFLEGCITMRIWQCYNRIPIQCHSVSYFDCWLPNLSAATADSAPSTAHIFEALLHACRLPVSIIWLLTLWLTAFQRCPFEFTTTTIPSTLQLSPAFVKPFLVRTPLLPNTLAILSKSHFSVRQMRLCTCELRPMPPLPELKHRSALLYNCPSWPWMQAPNRHLGLLNNHLQQPELDPKTTTLADYNNKLLKPLMLRGPYNNKNFKKPSIWATNTDTVPDQNERHSRLIRTLPCICLHAPVSPYNNNELSWSLRYFHEPYHNKELLWSCQNLAALLQLWPQERSCSR